MKTHTIKTYSFDELSDEAKEEAVDGLMDINIDHDWWNCTYEDAKTIGITIDGFDIDRHEMGGSLDEDGQTVANNILKEHGETCDTYIDAKSFLADYATLVAKYSDGVNIEQVTEDNEYEFDIEIDELEDDFKRTLLVDYLSMISKEYDYLTEEDTIIETIKLNDYEFTIDGKQY